MKKITKVTTPSGKVFLPALKSLPAPTDYYPRIQPSEHYIPENLLLFLRSSELALNESSRKSFQHHRYVLILNLETSGTVSIDGKWVSIHPGECLLVHPFQVHTYGKLDSVKMRWLFVTFELQENPKQSLPRGSALPFIPNTLQWVELLVHEVKQTTPRDFRMMLLLGIILEELIEQYKKKKHRSVPALENHGILPRIHALVSKENDDGFQIKDLAKKLGYSESHLRALFREEVGMGLGKYLLKIRLSRAAALLASNKLPINEVAVRCGYESPYSFSRAFKQKMHISPRNYRRLRFKTEKVGLPLK